MKRISFLIGLGFYILSIFIFPVNDYSQPIASLPQLSIQYEELTGPDFIRAVEGSDAVCIIPVGILEKHGPHLPLGTDLFDAREIALRAAKTEYCVVFPEYYFGQIYEAKHQPGTMAYSPDLTWRLLTETCNELSRNGFKKIVLVNGHGGNTHFLHYFCQAQLEERKAYTVILFTPYDDEKLQEKIGKLRRTNTGGHADEEETSMLLAHKPDLVHMERGKDQSGEDLKRMDHIPFGYTGIWWYARYPNHYAGDGSFASKEIGELILESAANQLATMIRAVKKDTIIQELEKRFFDESVNPLSTKQSSGLNR